MSDRGAQITRYNLAALSQNGGGGGGGVSTPVEGGNLVDVSVKEGKGTPIGGVTMPTDGVGLTGWLSAIFGAHGENPPAATDLVDVPPAGGKGALGWLSGIYNALTAGHKTHKVTLQEITSAASPFVIPAGATEVSLVNIGTANATVKTADMAAAGTLYPAAVGGLSITWRANAGGTLPAVTITVPAGTVVQASVIN